MDGKLVKSLPAITNGGNPTDRPIHIHQVQFLPGDRELAVVGRGNGGWAGIVDSNTGIPRVSFKQHSNSVFALDVSEDGKQVVSSGGNQHETLVWNADDGKVLHRMSGTGNGVWAIGWAKDGKSIAWGTSNKRGGDDELPLEHVFRLDEFGTGQRPPTCPKFLQVLTSDAGIKLMTGKDKFLVQTPGRDPRIISLAGETIFSATLLPKGNAVVVGGAASLTLLKPGRTYAAPAPTLATPATCCASPRPRTARYFATGSSDQTIRIWQRDSEDPMLSIFVAGREWIAWTPQGFYACSPQGERLIAWQVGTGARGHACVPGRAVPPVHVPACTPQVSHPVRRPRAGAGDGPEVRQGAHAHYQRGRRAAAGGDARRLRRSRVEGGRRIADCEGFRQEREAPPSPLCGCSWTGGRSRAPPG